MNRCVGRWLQLSLFLVVWPRLTWAGPRFAIAGSGDGSGTISTVAAKQLSAAGWLPIPPDDPSVKDVRVSIVSTSFPDRLCATASADWWDGSHAEHAGTCATKLDRYGFSVPPDLARIVGPLADALGEDARARWTLHLSHLDPTRLDTVTIDAGGREGHGYVVWTKTDGFLSMRHGGTATVGYGPCRLAAAGETPEVDLNALIQPRPLSLVFRQDDHEVSAVSIKKGQTLELTLERASSGPVALVPCSGDPVVELVSRPDQFDATNRDAVPWQRWSWSIITKTDEGSFLVHVRASNAKDDSGVSFEVPFRPPTTSRIWAFIAGAVGAIGIVVGGLGKVFDFVGKFRKPTPPASPPAADGQGDDLTG